MSQTESEMSLSPTFYLNTKLLLCVSLECQCLQTTWKLPGKETLTSSARHLDINSSLLISHRHPGKLLVLIPTPLGTELRGGLAELLSQTRTKKRTFLLLFCIILYNKSSALKDMPGQCHSNFRPELWEWELQSSGWEGRVVPREGSPQSRGWDMQAMPSLAAGAQVIQGAPSLTGGTKKRPCLS